MKMEKIHFSFKLNPYELDFIRFYWALIMRWSSVTPKKKLHSNQNEKHDCRMSNKKPDSNINQHKQSMILYGHKKRKKPKKEKTA